MVYRWSLVLCMAAIVGCNDHAGYQAPIERSATQIAEVEQPSGESVLPEVSPVESGPSAGVADEDAPEVTPASPANGAAENAEELTHSDEPKVASDDEASTGEPSAGQPTSPKPLRMEPIGQAFDTLQELIDSLGDGEEAVGDPLTVFKAEQAMETVRSADSVSAYLLDASSGQPETLDGYIMAQGPVGVSDAPASRLRDALLNPKTYGTVVAFGCIPSYGVRVQFVHGEDQVDVMLCFECSMFAVYHNGQLTGGKDFVAIVPQLVAFVKEIFPDDETIQALEG